MLSLDSRNASSIDNYPFNSKVKFDFTEPIFFPTGAITMTCSVLNFIAPNSLYNINETNSLIHIQYLGGVYPNVVTYQLYATIPYGNYNSGTFMTALKAALVSQASVFGNSFSITINSITNKFTLTSSTYVFSLMPDSTIYDVMGFYKTQAYGSATVATKQVIYAPYTCNFNGTNNINIHMGTFLTPNFDSFNKARSGIIASIPVDSNSSTISFLKQNDYAFSIKDNCIDSMHISIQDDLENYVNFNNKHWNMALCFQITRDVDRFSYENTFYNIMNRGYY
jgi:hypothetical protein